MRWVKEITHEEPKLFTQELGDRKARSWTPAVRLQSLCSSLLWANASHLTYVFFISWIFDKPITLFTLIWTLSNPLELQVWADQGDKEGNYPLLNTIHESLEPNVLLLYYAVITMAIPRTFLHTKLLIIQFSYPTCYNDFYFEYTMTELSILSLLYFIYLVWAWVKLLNPYFVI